MTNQNLFSVTEACERLRIGRTTLYDLVRTERLASVTIGTRRLIPAAAVDEFRVRLGSEASARRQRHNR